MSHGIRRAGHQPRPTIAAIDLGHEPPLSVDGTDVTFIDRRRVSVQWFSGTILTGLCGAALIGGAVFASLDGEMVFAHVPERVENALRGGFGAAERQVNRKADRLPPPGEASAARQVIRVSTVARHGNRDVVRVRPFVRIASNLSLTTSDLSAKIPPFNAQRLLTDVDTTTASVTGENQATMLEASEPDAEVTFVTRDLASILPRAKIATSVPIDDVVLRVRDASNWKGHNGGTEGVRYASTGTPADIRMAYAAESNVDLYAGFQVRVIPENVTMLGKTKDQITGGMPTSERVHLVRKGDSIASILRDAGATPDEAKVVAAQFGGRGRDGGLREGQKVRVLMAPAGPGRRPQAFRVIIANDTSLEAMVALSDLGKYVNVDVASLNTKGATVDVASNDDDDEEDDGRGVRLYQSIYETALRNKVPPAVIEDMIRVYSYDVDFQRRAQAGDSFEVFFASDDEASPDAKSDVLYASLTVGGDTKKYYRYQTPDDAVVDYYDETGKSAKKFLVRKPVASGVMRSGFGSRRHPILGYSRMHTGVDWSTPYGTPIFASGNGVIEKQGWEGGYGKYVRIKHPNGYETAYGHMSAFAKGLDVGKRVRQGQVIGYVGSTGLSTGAHVHYEILVNSRFVDPMRVRLPRGRSLEGQVLTAFEQERDKLEGMMTRGAGSRVAQGQQTPDTPITRSIAPR